MKTLNTINKVMKALEDIDIIDSSKRKYNQIHINEAYKLLENFRDELIRERINNSKKGGTKEDD